MSAEREKMKAALKSHVLPVLRSRGFKSSFPHFRRVSANGIHLLTFHFDKWGGGFIVEVASCPTDGITMHWGKQIPPAKVTAQHISSRLRLGASSGQSDHWFRYDRRRLLSFSDPCERAAREVLPYLDSQAEELLERITRISVGGITWDDLLLLGARTLEGLNLVVNSRDKKLVAAGPIPAA